MSSFGSTFLRGRRKKGFRRRPTPSVRTPTFLVPGLKTFLECGKRKGFIYYGPPGCGKAWNIFHDLELLGIAPMELALSAADWKQQLSDAATSNTLVTKTCLLLRHIDDCAGCATVLNNVLPHSARPVVMTMRSRPNGALTRKCVVTGASVPQISRIISILSSLPCSAGVPSASVRAVATRAGGNIAHAINQLTFLQRGGTFQHKAVAMFERPDTSVFETMDNLFLRGDRDLSRVADDFLLRQYVHHGLYALPAATVETSADVAECLSLADCAEAELLKSRNYNALGAVVTDLFYRVPITLARPRNPPSWVRWGRPAGLSHASAVAKAGRVKGKLLSPRVIDWTYVGGGVEGLRLYLCRVFRGDIRYTTLSDRFATYDDVIDAVAFCKLDEEWKRVPPATKRMMRSSFREWQVQHPRKRRASLSNQRRTKRRRER